MSVAVRGASGYVGGYVARALAASGHDVLSFGRRPAAELTRPLPSYIAWDVEQGPIAYPRVDAVVHCAAFVGDWGDESRYRAANVAGTVAVLDSFPSARRFVHMSTSSVYTSDTLRSVREDGDVGRSIHSTYGRSKAESERAVLSRRGDAVVLRPHIVYGPGDTTLLPRLLAARRFGRLPIPGDGRNRVSVTHVDNLAQAVQRALSGDARGAFNVSDAEPAVLDDLLRTVLGRIGEPARVVYVPADVAWIAAAALESVWPRGDSPRGPPLTRFAVKSLANEHTLDISRARRELGYAPRWTFRDGPLLDS